MTKIDRRIQPLTRVKIKGLSGWQTVKKVVNNKWVTLDEYCGHFQAAHIQVFSNKYRIKNGQSIRGYLGDLFK